MCHRFIMVVTLVGGMMNQNLKDRCELFISNRDLIKKYFRWENDTMHVLCGILLAGESRHADIEKMMTCEKILKDRTGVFSEFRGNLKMPIITKMSMAENAEIYFSQVEKIYNILNANKWFGSEYKILAAMTICDHARELEYEVIVKRTQAIYQCMKKEHPFLTSDEDTSYAAMLALSDADIGSLIQEMEKCYTFLKKDFISSNAVQSLSHILALNGLPTEEKCQKVKEIFQALKNKKRKYGTGYELASLGAVSLLDLSVEDIVNEIIGVDDFLRVQKGFGTLGIGGAQRLMYAALLVADTYMPESKTMQNSVMGSALSTIIAQQVAMTAIIVTMVVNSTNSDT